MIGFLSGRKVGTTLLAVLVLVATLSAMASVTTTEAEATVTLPSWETEASLPNDIAQAAVVSDDEGAMYVFGGATDTTFTPLNTTFKYDPATDSWTTLAPMWVAVRGAAVAIGPYGMIYIFGGVGPSGTLDTVQIYNPDTNNWSLSWSVLSTPVWEAKACYHEATGRVYIVGGESLGMVLKTVQFYDPHYDATGVLDSGSFLPEARAGGDLVSNPYGTKLWYFAGEDSTRHWTNNILEFDPATGAWSELFVMNGLFCAQEVVEGADGLYYVLGGGPDVTNLGEGSEYCFVYDPFNNGWFGIPDLPYQAKYLGAGATPDGRIFAIGGSNDGTASSSVYSLRVLTYDVSVPSTVRAGESVTVKVSVDAPFATIETFDLGVYAKGPDNVTFGSEEITTYTDDAFCFDIAVPQGAATGTYQIVIPWLYLQYAGWGYAELGEKTVAFTVVEQGSTSEQISNLQDQLDGKADTTLVYLTIVLLVAVIVLLAFTLFRRRT